jgi:glutamate dehydrogenase/leucine dehydrogenase
MLHAGQVPTREQLEALTEDQILEVLDAIAEAGNVSVGANWWVSELARVRLEAVLKRIAAATEENARHVSEMRNYARAADAASGRQWRLTIANSVLAAVAALAAIVALL